MDSFKQRLLEFISSNQPVTNKDLHQHLDASWKAIRTEIARLRNIGLVHTQIAVGHFLSKDDYARWLTSDSGRECMTRRAKPGALRSKEARSRNGTTRGRIHKTLEQYGPLHGREIADLMSVSYKSIASQICEMVDSGTLVKSGTPGSYMYDTTGGSEVILEQQDIFTQCRNSEAMKRVLSFYGRPVQ